MSKSNWRGHLALGGIAIAILFVISLVHYHPQSRWLIKNSHIPASNRKGPTTEYERAATDAFAWLHAVKKQGQAEPSSDESAKQAEKGQALKDPLDLTAQWVSAISADKIVTLSIWQLIIGFAGFAVLIYSLHLTRRSLALAVKTLNANAESAVGAVRAADAAENAILVQQRIGEAQTRAYISVESATFEIDPKLFYPIVRFKIKNSGNSPARQLMIGYRGGYRLDNSARVQPDFAPKGRDSYSWGTDIAGGEAREIVTRLTNFPLNQEEITGLSAKAILIFESMVKFEFIDVFDRPISEVQDWCGFVVDPGIQTPFLRAAFVSFRLIEDRAQAKGQ